MTDRDDLFAELLAYYPAVVRLILRQGFSRADAEDLTQDVFLRAYVSRDLYRGEARWRYVSKIAQNVVASRVRAQHAAKRYPSAVSADMDAFPAPSPDEALAMREHAATLGTAVKRLPPPIREPVVLQLQGLSYSEIAAALNIGVSDAKSRLRAARAQLREILAAGELKIPGIEAISVKHSEKHGERNSSAVRGHSSAELVQVAASQGYPEERLWDLVVEQLRILDESVTAMRTSIRQTLKG